MTNPWFDSSVFTFTAEQLRALFPYIGLCGGIAIATIGAGVGFSAVVMRWLQALILAPYAGFLLWTFREAPQSLFGTSLEVDTITRLVGASTAILAILSSFLSGKDKSRHVEWAPLMLISVLGMSLLSGARDWVAFFVFLETFSIAGYVLTAMDLHREGSLEAGLKYLLLGAFTSALLLMGLTLLYGSSGSFDFATIKATLGRGQDMYSVALVGALLVASSLAFKVALVPFHMWAPDVYQGAPFAAGGFLASATKVAVFGAMIASFERNGFLAVSAIKNWIQWLAILSVIIGNLMAWVQKSLRRMMAYSSVANAGYAALALSVGVTAAGSVLLSLLIYGVTVIAAFAMIEALCRNSDNKERFDLQMSEVGAAARRSSPVITVLFAALLFSLAGIPPLPGFLAKYVVLRDLLGAGFAVGAVTLIFGSLLGLGYYLRTLIPLFMEESDSKGARKLGFSLAGGPVFAGVLSACVLLGCLIGFGRLQQWLELVEGFAR